MSGRTSTSRVSPAIGLAPSMEAIATSRSRTKRPRPRRGLRGRMAPRIADHPYCLRPWVRGAINQIAVWFSTLRQLTRSRHRTSVRRSYVMTRSDGSERLHSQRARRAAPHVDPAGGSRRRRRRPSGGAGRRAAAHARRRRLESVGARVRSSSCTGRPPTAPHTDIVHDGRGRGRTSPRRRSSPRCARWTASTHGGPLRPGINRIVVNRAIDFGRARALRREVGAELAAPAEAPPEAPASRITCSPHWPR